MNMMPTKTKMGIYKAPFHMCPQNSFYLIKQVFYEIRFEILKLVYFILEETTTREVRWLPKVMEQVYNSRIGPIVELKSPDSHSF